MTTDIYKKSRIKNTGLFIATLILSMGLLTSSAYGQKKKKQAPVIPGLNAYSFSDLKDR